MERIEWIEKYMTNAERLIYENQVEDGLRMLNGLLYEEPGYSNLHNYLGWAYMYYTQDGERAELHLKMAIRFASDFAPPYLHMGSLLNRSGRYAEAIAYFQQGLTKANANRVALLEGMALAYEMRSEFKEAVKAYKDAARSSVVPYEVDRMMQSVKRCRKKRIVFLFAF